MTYAQLMVLAEAAHHEVFELLYTGYRGDVELEVGFEADQARAAAKLVYDSVIEAGGPFIHPIPEVA